MILHLALQRMLNYRLPHLAMPHMAMEVLEIE